MSVSMYFVSYSNDLIEMIMMLNHDMIIIDAPMIQSGYTVPNDEVYTCMSAFNCKLYFLY